MNPILEKATHLYHEQLRNPKNSHLTRSYLDHVLGFKHVCDLDELILSHRLGTSSHSLPSVGKMLNQEFLYGDLFHLRLVSDSNEFVTFQPSVVIPLTVDNQVQQLYSFEPDRGTTFRRTPRNHWEKPIFVSGDVIVTQDEMVALMIRTLGFQAYPYWMFNANVDGNFPVFDYRDASLFLLYHDTEMERDVFEQAAADFMRRDYEVKTIATPYDPLLFFSHHQKQSREVFGNMKSTAKNPISSLFL